MSYAVAYKFNGGRSLWHILFHQLNRNCTISCNFSGLTNFLSTELQKISSKVLFTLINSFKAR